MYYMRTHVVSIRQPVIVAWNPAHEEESRLPQERVLTSLRKAVVAIRGYHFGYQPVSGCRKPSETVGMGRFELPTPCSQIVSGPSQGR